MQLKKKKKKKKKTISRNIGMLTKLKHFVPENILYSNCTLISP